MELLSFLNITQEELNKLKGSDEISFICPSCNKPAKKDKNRIHNALKAGRAKIFCSNECHLKHVHGDIAGNHITKEELESFIKLGKSAREIAELTKLTQPQIQYLFKKFKLKGANPKKHLVLLNKKRTKNWDFPAIQNFYNENHSWEETEKQFNISRGTIYLATKAGKLVSRKSEETSKMRGSKKHSDETKLKMSERRKQFLANNPNKHSWRRKDKKTSVPCELFKQKLKELDIPFIEELQPLLEQGRFFSIDISIPEKGIAIEINGNQHYNRDGTLKPYYQERHDLIVTQGWKIYEIPFASVMVPKVLDKIIEIILKSEILPSPLIQPRFKKLKNTVCARCGIKTGGNGTNCKACVGIIRTEEHNKTLPEKSYLHWLVWNYPMTTIAEKLFNKSDNAIKKWCKKLNIITPNRGYWNKMEHGIITDYQI